MDTTNLGEGSTEKCGQIFAHRNVVKCLYREMWSHICAEKCGRIFVQRNVVAYLYREMWSNICTEKCGQKNRENVIKYAEKCGQMFVQRNVVK